jgi:hypothetical protein
MNTEAVLRQLVDVLALGDPIVQAIVNLGGINTPRKLGMMREKDLADMGKTISGIPANRGGVVISNAAIRYLGGLSYWIRDRIRRGQFDLMNPVDFTIGVCEDCIARMDFETRDEKLGDAVKSLHPGKIKGGKGWTQWELGFINYLTGVRGKSGIPLHYIIRKALPPGHVFNDDVERLVHEAVLQGVAFEEDNRTVYQFLKNCALETPAWEWIRALDARQDGRQAMAALRQHYDGPGEVEKRLAFAKKQLSEIHYRSEQTFPFESYVTKLKGAFEVLEECNEAYTERNKVSILLEKIQINNTQIQSAKTSVMMNDALKTDFNAAANCLSEIVSTVFPAVQTRFGRRVSAVTNPGRGRPNAGRGTGRGGRGGGRGSLARGIRNKNVNGVNISDPFRNFTPEEWGKLTQDARNEIRAAREAKKEQKKRKVSVIEVGTESDIVTEVTDTQGSGTGTVVTSEDMVARPAFGKTAYKRSLSVIKTSQRVFKIETKGYKDTRFSGDQVVARCEVDNHADTCCLGPNFVPLYFTGVECEVQPFSDNYESVKQVPVCSAVTAYDDEETGLTYLLEFNECLWMPN